jgi:hypothetical protein
MPNDRPARVAASPAQGSATSHTAWARPSFEVIPLDCEITAYAPDGDSPLF